MAHLKSSFTLQVACLLFTSLVSVMSILWSEHISCTFSVKYLFLWSYYINGIVFLVLVYTCSLLVYRNTVGFSMLVLYFVM